MAENTNNWPKTGDKLTFLSAEGFHYPRFENIIDFAKRNLIEGQKYTVKNSEMHFSWAGEWRAVWLSDVGLTDCPFHLSMFEWEQKEN